MFDFLTIDVLCMTANFGHAFDMSAFDFLLKPPQPSTGLFFHLIHARSIENTLAPPFLSHPLDMQPDKLKVALCKQSRFTVYGQLNVSYLCRIV